MFRAGLCKTVQVKQGNMEKIHGNIELKSPKVHIIIIYNSHKNIKVQLHKMYPAYHSHSTGRAIVLLKGIRERTFC